MPDSIDDTTPLDRPATLRQLRVELGAYATKDDVKAFATKDDLKGFATKDDLNDLRDELRTHFKVVYEKFDETSRNYFEGLGSAHDETDKRQKRVEGEHGTRLASLEKRVTRLERRK